jgi:hypothetical protein
VPHSLQKQNQNKSWALVAHTCNPSYSEGRDQEDRGSKSATGKEFWRPYLENIHHKKGVAQGVGPEFKPQHHKKQTKNKSKIN